MKHQASIALQNTSPPPEDICRAVEEVLSRPYYEDKPSLAEGVINGFFQSITEVIEKYLAPIISALDRTINLAFSFRDDSPILFWTVVGCLSLLLVVIVTRLALKLYKAIKARRLERTYPDTLLSSKAVTPEMLEAEAAEAGDEGDLILALRLLFMAGVMRLEKASDNFYKPALTNAEYLRRFSKTDAEAPLTFMAQALNRWYAGETCDQAVYEKGLAAHKQLVILAQEQN
ncbi:hypothetical protein [Pseudodesulfovibrio sediminis]|uniref:hypothetical protein n=1 Tax=Pseudodesulfovibrio sediminis TaxID=2810563 RepID=UPI001E60D46B|nr:hypothetical protein [Pseudodesulfovibrio sediminis]